MKRAIFLVFMILIASGCSNVKYNSMIPVEDNKIYGVEKLKWSPDGKRIAILTNKNIFIIDPDGNILNDVGKENDEGFNTYEWSNTNNEWRFIKSSDPYKEKIGSGNEIHENDGETYDFVVGDIYQKISIEKNEYVIAQKDIRSIVAEIKVKEKSYNIIFESTQLLGSLTLYNDKLYFVGINPDSITKKYTLYKIISDKIERVEIGYEK